MGKKRKSKAFRPWCWYCEKEFEDDKGLVDHQKGKHFKCETCYKKLTTAGGLRVHAQTQHGIEMMRVPNALPERADPDLAEIFGMEGIPPEDLMKFEEKRGRGNIEKRARPASSGNYEELTPEQIQAQLALHKARANADSSSTSAAPTSGVSSVIAAAPVLASPGEPPAYPAAQPYGMPYPYNYHPYYHHAPPGQMYGQMPPSAPSYHGAPPYPYGVPPHGVPPHSGPPPLPVPAPVSPAASAPISAPVSSAAPTASQGAAQAGFSTSTSVSPTAASAPAPAQPTQIPPKKKVVLIYNNNEESPEEQRAQLEKHKIKC